MRLSEAEYGQQQQRCRPKEMTVPDYHQYSAGEGGMGEVYWTHSGSLHCCVSVGGGWGGGGGVKHHTALIFLLCSTF